MAVMRAGVTHWHAGLIEAGHGMICKAYAILLITHGPSHPITKDLEVGVRISLLVSAIRPGTVTFIIMLQCAGKCLFLPIGKFHP